MAEDGVMDKVNKAFEVIGPTLGTIIVLFLLKKVWDWYVAKKANKLAAAEAAPAEEAKV
jgi:hypothetical protein